MTTPNIYEDLGSINLGEKVLKLEAQNQTLVDHIKSLENDISKLCAELKHMKTTESNLKRNISELFNTAKLEIQRKDRMIADLRKQLDDLLFRRHNHHPIRNRGEEATPRENPINAGKRTRDDVALSSTSDKRRKCEDLLYKGALRRESRDRSSSNSPARKARRRSPPRDRKDSRDYNHRRRSSERHHHKSRERECIRKEHNQSRSRSKDRDFKTNRSFNSDRSKDQSKAREKNSDKYSNGINVNNKKVDLKEETFKENLCRSDKQICHRSSTGDSVNIKTESKSITVIKANNLPDTQNPRNVEVKQEDCYVENVHNGSKIRDGIVIKSENAAASLNTINSKNSVMAQHFLGTSIELKNSLQKDHINLSDHCDSTVNSKTDQPNNYHIKTEDHQNPSKISNDTFTEDENKVDLKNAHLTFVKTENGLGIAENKSHTGVSDVNIKIENTSLTESNMDTVLSNDNFSCVNTIDGPSYQIISQCNSSTEMHLEPKQTVQSEKNIDVCNFTKSAVLNPRRRRRCIVKIVT